MASAISSGVPQPAHRDRAMRRLSSVDVRGEMTADPRFTRMTVSATSWTNRRVRVSRRPWTQRSPRSGPRPPIHRGAGGDVDDAPPCPFACIRRTASQEARRKTRRTRGPNLIEVPDSILNTGPTGEISPGLLTRPPSGKKCRLCEQTTESHLHGHVTPAR